MAARKKRSTTKKKAASKLETTRRDLLKTIAAGAAVILPAVQERSSAAPFKRSADPCTWQEFQLKLVLNVPRIYDNAESKGSRKYQKQQISGKLLLGFGSDGKLADIAVDGLVNKTHKLSNGKNVTYKTQIDADMCFPRFNAVGSNKTGMFRTASVCFAIGAEPNYNIGEYDEDTSLFIVLAGKGIVNAKTGSIQQVTGYVAGSLGCGCSAYGHKSPTRKLGKNGPTDVVDDVASVYGTWSMKFIRG